MSTTIVPDTQWFRSTDGLGVLAGSPLTFFRVSQAGALVLNAIENSTPLPSAHQQLTERLLLAGAAHPMPSTQADAADITVVIPAFISDATQLKNLQELIHLLHPLRVIVIDDCSPFSIEVRHAEVVSHRTNLGPGVARNTGLQLVMTPYVAFVDADTSITASQLQTLGAYLSDGRTQLVAPRVRTLDTRSALSEYESHHSPLDLGAQPAVVRPLSRVSYVPAAVCVARTSTVTSVGGFSTSMRLGEDVDLVWRLAKSGAVSRYVPHVECTHAARNSVRSLLRQRFGYGSSAASLDAQHPFTAAPLRAHALLLAISVLILSGYLFFAALTLPIVFIYFAVTLRKTSLSVKQRLRITVIGLVATVRLTASAITRAWWPIFFLTSIIFFRPGFALALSAFAPVMFGLMRYKPQHPIRYSVLRILDPLAYCLGVWSGALRQRSLRCLVPVVTVRRSVSR
jgi:mycofactocin system glycosyltransferase